MKIKNYIKIWYKFFKAKKIGKTKQNNIYGASLVHPIPPLLHYEKSIEVLYNFLHEQYTDQDPAVVEAINNAMLALYTLEEMHLKGEYYE